MKLHITSFRSQEQREAANLIDDLENLADIARNVSMSGPGKDAITNKHGDSKSKVVNDLQFISYGNEKESPYLPAIRQLISKDLSEPYSIYVYRYFLYQWGDLCFMVSLPLRLQNNCSLIQAGLGQ